MPVKRGLSDYIVTNKTSTTDKRHSIIEILDKGRGPVYPKKAKRLYIPLSNKGRSKIAGAPIPNGFVYGTDYIFAMKAGPTKGKFFIRKINREATMMIDRESLALIAGI